MAVRILVGDCRAKLRELDAGSIHAVVTSPPYYGLRDYGEDGQIGLEPTPDAYVAEMVGVFREVRRVLRDDGVCWLNLGDSYGVGHGGDATTSKKQRSNVGTMMAPRGGCMSGNLLGIPWRVAFALQADGWTLRSAVVWAKPNPMPESVAGTRWERCRVRVGKSERATADVYTGNATDTPQSQVRGPARNYDVPQDGVWSDCPGCPKCEATGGYVLRRGSWRPTSSHEFVFMLTKGMDYTAQQEQVREALTEWSQKALEGNWTRKSMDCADGSGTSGTGWAPGKDYGAHINPAGRNPRDVRTIATQPFSGAHFAVMPPDLAEWCIRASTSDHGCCSACGEQWAPVVERTGRIVMTPDLYGRPRTRVVSTGKDYATDGDALRRQSAASGEPCGLGTIEKDIIDHRPTCSCDAPAEPCRILDPFGGAGTTALVADRLGRDAVLIDLSAEYCEMARERIAGENPMFADVVVSQSRD